MTIPPEPLAFTDDAIREAAIANLQISDEEFDAAKAHLMAVHGEIPPSLQDVIDRGGRFKRAEPLPALPERVPQATVAQWQAAVQEALNPEALADAVPLVSLAAEPEENEAEE